MTRILIALAVASMLLTSTGTARAYRWRSKGAEWHGAEDGCWWRRPWGQDDQRRQGNKPLNDED